MKKILLPKWMLFRHAYSQFKTQYFQWLFESETNYGMISCPSGKIAQSKGRIGSIILLGHEKEVIYMLIYDEVLKI